MKPSIGRIVHYILTMTGPVVAAIITDVHEEGIVNLRLFFNMHDAELQGQDAFRFGVVHSEIPVFGTWHWPPKV